MKTHYKFFLAILILCLTYSFSFCQSANSLRKTGEELESAGSYEKAADYFYRALLKKEDDVKSMLGLERTAAKVMDDMLNEVNNNFNSQNYDMAIVKINSAIDYQAKVKRVGINIDVPQVYFDKLNQCKEILADKYYNSGKLHLNSGNYSSAISDFEKSLTYKSFYKDATALINEAKDAKNNADAERYYNSGVTKLNSKNYRGAYYDFETCLSYKSSFKDAYSLRRESLEKGKIRVGIIEFKNDTRISGAHGTLYSYVVSNAVNNKSPFIEIIDRDNLQRLLREQQLGTSGIVDESSAVKVGRILGLSYIVIGRLTNVTQSGGDVKSQQINAYELYTSKTSDGKDILQGKPITFMLYEGSATFTFEASYQIISVETSKILASDIVSSSEEDYIKYATYNGDYKRLCAIQPDHTIAMQILAANSMIDQNLFTARKTMKTPTEMQTNIIKDLASRISDAVIKNLNK